MMVPGVQMSNLTQYGQPKWGYVEKCPYCPEERIPKRSPTQRTCGGYKCQLAAAKAGVRRRAKK